MIITIKKINYIVISCLMIIVMSFSFFVSVKYFSDGLATFESHSVFLSSHLNYHERDNHHKVLDTQDEDEVRHSHTHRHSEGEKEHTHKHVNIVTFSEIIIYQKVSLFLHSEEIIHTAPNSYTRLYTDSFTLEILRPPIYS